MSPEQIRYWIAIGVGIPLTVIFLIMITVFSAAPLKSSRSRRLRSVAAGSLCIGIASAVTNALLLVLRPTGYADWMSHGACCSSLLLSHRH